MKKANNNKNMEKFFASNEVMAMLENMNDGIQVIAEQHGGIVNRLDKIDNRLDKMDDRFDKIDVRLDKMDDRFDKVDARFDKIDIRLDKLQDDVTEIKYKLSEKVDMKDFKKLEKRLIKLEKVVLA